MPRISKSPLELRKDIMEACIEVFNEKGLKFTMDDLTLNRQAKETGQNKSEFEADVVNFTVQKVITKTDNIGIYLTRSTAPYPKGKSVRLRLR